MNIDDEEQKLNSKLIKLASPSESYQAPSMIQTSGNLKSDANDVLF